MMGWWECYFIGNFSSAWVYCLSRCISPSHHVSICQNYTIWRTLKFHNPTSNTLPKTNLREREKKVIMYKKEKLLQHILLKRKWMHYNQKISINSKKPQGHTPRRSSVLSEASDKWTWVEPHGTDLCDEIVAHRFHLDTKSPGHIFRGELTWLCNCTSIRF
jgi:hypothetical protein